MNRLLLAIAVCGFFAPEAEAGNRNHGSVHRLFGGNTSKARSRSYKSPRTRTPINVRSTISVVGYGYRSYYDRYLNDFLRGYYTPKELPFYQNRWFYDNPTIRYRHDPRVAAPSVGAPSRATITTGSKLYKIETSEVKENGKTTEWKVEYFDTGGW